MKLSRETRRLLADAVNDDPTIYQKDDGGMDWKRLGKVMGFWLILIAIPVLIIRLLPGR
jgi:hypothetical protein